MNSEVFLVVAFGILVALFVVMLLVGIPRGKRMQKTNEKIEQNQRRQLALAERQTAAIERIAYTFENRK